MHQGQHQTVRDLIHSSVWNSSIGFVVRKTQPIPNALEPNINEQTLEIRCQMVLLQGPDSARSMVNLLCRKWVEKALSLPDLQTIFIARQCSNIGGPFNPSWNTSIYFNIVDLIWVQWAAWRQVARLMEMQMPLWRRLCAVFFSHCESFE